MPVRKKVLKKKTIARKTRRKKNLSPSKVLDKNGHLPLPVPGISQMLTVAGDEVKIEKVLSGFILQGFTLEESANVLGVDPKALESAYGDMFKNHVQMLRALFVNQVYELAVCGHQQALKIVQGQMEQDDESERQSSRDAFFGARSDDELRRMVDVLAEESTQEQKRTNGGSPGRTRKKKSFGLH